jgi:ParB family transcriptional regulator, chromosome partitioning protein
MDAIGGQSYNLSYIPFEDVLPNILNDYPMEDLDLLAFSIKQIGLMKNLVVIPSGNGKYTVISGQRRLMAIAKIREKDPNEFRFLPCIVDMSIKSEADQIIKITQFNRKAKRPPLDIYNDYIATDYAEIKALYQIYQKNGFLKNIRTKRDYYALYLRTSGTQIQRFNNINKNLISELKEKLQSKRISVSLADYLAKQSIQKQMEAYQIIEQKT